MPSYLQIDDLLCQLDEPYQSKCRQIVSENRVLFEQARGSSNNHQAWTGGYIDHLHEVMNLAVVLYPTMKELRPLPFSLSDALLVLFVHDLEKPWTYEQIDGNWQRKKEFRGKDEAQAFRLRKLAEYGLQLPPELDRAVFFVEGELGHYTNQQRAMSPLAAFCHMCDVASARLWYDYPQASDDPWQGAKRFTDD
jgi:hypothetical protein